MDFQWKTGAHVANVDPAKAARLFDRLRSRNGGELTIDEVVEAARPVTSPIHKFIFELNDSEAAEQHRRERAGYLIRMLVVVHQEDAVPVRALVSVRPSVSASPVYRDRDEVLADPDLRAQVIVQGIREYNALNTKYNDLGELEPIAVAVEKVEADLGLLIEEG